MPDTKRTVNALLTQLFQDGQPASSISPQDARDMIKSSWSGSGAAIPGATLDAANGFEPGNLYVQTGASPAIWLCRDNTTNAAVWRKTTIAQIVGGGGGGGPTAPPQAVAAGFNTLVFSDEFTSINTIDTTGTASFASTGKKWFNRTFGNGTAAISVANSICEIRYNGQPGGLTSTDSSLAGFAAGARYYAEANFKWDTINNSWPAWWTFAIEHFNGGVTGNDALECDYIEAGGADWPAQPGLLYSIHGWSDSNVDGVGRSNMVRMPGLDVANTFHTYGILWSGNTFSWWLDDVQKDSFTYTGHTAWASQHFQQILAVQAWNNTATPWSMFVDWARVWR